MRGKRQRRIVAFLVVTVLLVISINKTGIYAASSEIDDGIKLLIAMYKNQSAIPDNESASDLYIQGKLNELYDKVKKIYINDDNVDLSLYNGTGEKYSNNYGGAYIDDGKLIVCLTADDDNGVLESDLIKYRTVSNSYNYLQNIKNELSSKYVELYKQTFDEQSKEYRLLSSIVGIGIDEKKNCVICDISYLEDEKIETFENLFGKMNCICLQEAGEGPKDDAASYKPGQGICVIRTQSGSNLTFSTVSIGYRAYYSSPTGTKYGFTTCGHGIKDAINSNVYSDLSLSTIVGTIVTWAYSGSVDASFIELNGSDSITMVTQYSDANGTTTGGDSIASYIYMSSVAQGATVYKVGCTTYKTSAEVLNTNYDFTVNGVTFTNLTKTDEFTDSGDSGGLVYMYYDSQYIPAGLVKGHGGFWIFSYSVYVKASEVVSYNIYPY